MQPGRKPKANEIKKRTGSPNYKPDAPTPPRGAPDCPKHVRANPAALEAWDSLCETLDDMQILSPSDMVLMMICADTMAEYVALQTKIAECGDEMVSGVQLSSKTNTPFITAYANRAAMLKKQLMACIVEMGLTPSSRSRVTAMPKQDDPQGKSRFFKVVG